MPDPAAPELYESAFPRDGFPRYEWTERPRSLPPVVWTTETTHRDGQQGGLPLTVEQGIRIFLTGGMALSSRLKARRGDDRVGDFRV